MSLQLSAQFGADHLVHTLAVSILARQFLHGGFHHFAQVLRSCSAGFCNGGSHRNADLFIARFSGQVGLQDFRFRFLFGGQVFAAALAELLHRIAPLFHQGPQHGYGLVIVEGLAEFDLFVLEGGLGHPQHGEPKLFPRLHGSHQVFLHLFRNRHCQ